LNEFPGLMFLAMFRDRVSSSLELERGPEGGNDNFNAIYAMGLSLLA
jgi:hypothetical protein